MALVGKVGRISGMKNDYLRSHTFGGCEGTFYLILEYHTGKSCFGLVDNLPFNYLTCSFTGETDLGKIM